MAIQMKTMDEALKRVRLAEREARQAAHRGDNQACYAALERTQHAAFDARALFSGAPLPDDGE